MKRIYLIYIILSAALIINLTLDIIKGISLQGYWADRILFWIWLVYTVYILIKYWSKKGVKFYVWTLTALLGLSMLPMFIPFTAIIFTGFGLDRTYGNDFNDNLRVQVTGKSIMGRPNVELIRKYGLYGVVLGEMSGFDLVDDLDDLENVKRVKILEEKENNLLVEFYFPNGGNRHWLDKK
ncbi:hypothetical protein [Rufibacter ruber]|uniref:hypothetical protein n=1 Tax=Rufibacter ruber TaxID=1783499 RepID=UPI000832494E|nr:hypothetical protein [Rufibacter ruber]